MRTSQTEVLRTRLFVGDINQCSKLASILGLGAPLIRQIAMMATLIQSLTIPVEHNNQMVETLRRFREWIERRAKRAEQLKARVERESRAKPKKIGPRKSWEDVIV